MGLRSEGQKFISKFILIIGMISLFFLAKLTNIKYETDIKQHNKQSKFCGNIGGNLTLDFLGKD